jgi:hypothetical protein
MPAWPQRRRVYLVLLHFLIGDGAPMKHFCLNFFVAFKEKPGLWGPDCS